MRLSELLEGRHAAPQNDPEITFITDDTRRVIPGALFICVKGGRFDGHTAAADMLEKGAAAVVCDHDLGLGDRQIVVPDTRAEYGALCAAWCGHPERKMRFIGVTGTNGKTTITTVIKYLLTAAGHKVGLIGTIQNEIGDQILHTENTTPVTLELFELYRRMYEAGCDYVVMEVSSFGLVQKRIGPTHFDVAVFTNLTQDHLDYHKTMEAYYEAKRMLFDICDTAVINTDDDYGIRLFKETACRKYSYGREAHDHVPAFAYAPGKVRADGASFTLHVSADHMDDRYYQIDMRMTGYFNIANATAAFAACSLLGDEKLTVPGMLESLQSCPGVRGRCEVIPTGRDFSVICDYAHTPDAIENILENVKLYTEGRLVCLFGCGGDRDRTKRPLMAQAAAKFADKLIVTSDNPRTEDPEAIIRDILAGLADSAVPYDTVIDRREAIAHAMRTAEPGDVIVLAGKGHEDYQIFGTDKKHFDEREVVADILKTL